MKIKTKLHNISKGGFIDIFIMTAFAKAPNGLRYPRVGGRGQGLRCRKSPKPEKCL
jgi:hypothetical protein